MSDSYSGYCMRNSILGRKDRGILCQMNQRCTNIFHHWLSFQLDNLNKLQASPWCKSSNWSLSSCYSDQIQHNTHLDTGSFHPSKPANLDMFRNKYCLWLLFWRHMPNSWYRFPSSCRKPIKFCSAQTWQFQHYAHLHRLCTAQQSLNTTAWHSQSLQSHILHWMLSHLTPW